MLTWTTELKDSAKATRSLVGKMRSKLASLEGRAPEMAAWQRVWREGIPLWMETVCSRFLVATNSFLS